MNVINSSTKTPNNYNLHLVIPTCIVLDLFTFISKHTLSTSLLYIIEFFIDKVLYVTSPYKGETKRNICYFLVSLPGVTDWDVQVHNPLYCARYSL